jgi:hypothetical protein
MYVQETAVLGQLPTQPEVRKRERGTDWSPTFVINWSVG